jgi:hypothetical protein
VLFFLVVGESQGDYTEVRCRENRALSAQANLFKYADIQGYNGLKVGITMEVSTATLFMRSFRPSTMQFFRKSRSR